jgi:hypothetical protein
VINLFKNILDGVTRESLTTFFDKTNIQFWKEWSTIGRYNKQIHRKNRVLELFGNFSSTAEMITEFERQHNGKERMKRSVDDAVKQYEIDLHEFAFKIIVPAEKGYRETWGGEPMMVYKANSDTKYSAIIAFYPSFCIKVQTDLQNYKNETHVSLKVSLVKYSGHLYQEFPYTDIQWTLMHHKESIPKRYRPETCSHSELMDILKENLHDTKGTRLMRIALAQGQHERLGRHSSLGKVPPDIVHRIADMSLPLPTLEYEVLIFPGMASATQTTCRACGKVIALE